jgi:DNA invertase Pin-like site-specific DNA recombinase
MTAPRRYLLYSRVSTHEQTRPGYGSLDAQEDVGRRHIAHLHLVAGFTDAPSIAVYREEGVSGKSLDRPALAALRADAERGNAVIVVYKLDRLTRSLFDFLTLNAELEACGAGVVSITEQFDTTTPMGRAMLHILLVFAQMERETTGQRIRGKHDALAAAGRYIGGRRPYGYRAERGKGLVVIEEQARVIRDIFQWFGRDGETTVQIALRLNRSGVPAPRGDTWTSRRVRDILGAGHLRGVQTYGERVSEWPYPAIVEGPILAAVDRRLSDTAVTRGRNRVLWEWRGLIVCPQCGWRYTRDVSKAMLATGPKAYTIYRCSRRRRTREEGRAPCSDPRLKDRHMESLTAAVLDAAARSQPAPLPEPPPDTGPRLAAAREKRRRAKLLFLDPAMGGMSESEYRAILAECDRLEAELQPPPSVAFLGVTIAAAWEGLSVQERNDALRLMVDRAVVYVDRVEIETRPTGWLGWPERMTVPLLG